MDTELNNKNEDGSIMTFIQWEKTLECKNMIEECSKDYPNTPIYQIKLMISLWYNKEILGLDVDENVEAPVIEETIKAIEVYDQLDHVMKFPHLYEDENNNKLKLEEVTYFDDKLEDENLIINELN